MDYDVFSSDYDRFVNWTGRLGYELPLLENLLATVIRPDGQPLRILDAACGTGMHAIALAQRGYRVYGADLSAGMVTRARENAAAAGAAVTFAQAGFGELAAAFRNEVAAGGFDALVCLGNSLPHVADAQALEQALRDFAACLRPGGMLVLQNRNFDAVLAQRDRWMEPQAHREGADEWLFVRFYDFTPNGKIDFHVITLRRAAGGAWQQSVMTTALLPLPEPLLTEALRQAGFNQVHAYGDLAGSPFDPGSSGNLVMVSQL